MNAFLMLAAAAALITAIAHTVTGFFVVRPVLNTQRLTRTVVFTVHYAWHVVGVTLLAMAAGFAYAAYEPQAELLATMMTILAAAFAFLNVGIIAARRISPLLVVHWLPIAMTGALGFLGVVYGG